MMMTRRSHEFEVDEREHAKSGRWCPVLAVMLHPLYNAARDVIGNSNPLSLRPLKAMRPFVITSPGQNLGCPGGVVDAVVPPRVC